MSVMFFGTLPAQRDRGVGFRRVQRVIELKTLVTGQRLGLIGRAGAFQLYTFGGLARPAETSTPHRVTLRA